MAIADTVARKLLQGAAVARGVVSFSFGLDGLWQLISGFFADIFAGLSHLLVLSLEALWHLLVAAVSGLGGLWNLVTGFLPHIVADLWHLLVAAVSGAAGVISSGLGGLWHLVAGFFPHLFAALAGAVSSGLSCLWYLATGLLPRLLADLWHLLVAAVTSGLGVLWQIAAVVLPHLVTALAGAAHHLLVLPLEALWRWLQSAAAVTLPYILALLAVVLFWLCARALCAATVRVCRALVLAACCLAQGLYLAGAAIVRICRALVLAAYCLVHGLHFAGAAAERRVPFLPPTRGQQQQQDDDEEASFLAVVVDTAAWEEVEVDGGSDVHHAWHIRTTGLDERAIAAIGVVVYDAEEQQLHPCTMCLDELCDGEALRLLPPCEHAFHRHCIDRWLRDHDKCPNCRRLVQVDTTGAKSATATAANTLTEEAERARMT